MNPPESAARVLWAPRAALRILAVIAGLWSAGTAGAEVARVRSGDHGSFTRLVIELAAPADWRFGRAGAGYGLDFGRRDVQLDLGDVFGKIRRTRVSDVAQDPASGRLQIGLGCEPCHATALDYRDTWIVIDVADGPPPPGSPFEAELAAPAGLTETAPVADPRPALRASASVPRPLPRPSSAISPASGEDTGPAALPVPPDAALPAEAPDAVAPAGTAPAHRSGSSRRSAWTGARRAETLRPPETGDAPSTAAASLPAAEPEPAFTGDADRARPDRPAAPPVGIVDGLPWLSPAGALPPGLADRAPHPTRVRGSGDPADAGEAADIQGADLAGYRDRLIEELSRAASQGLLEPDLPLLDRARTPVAGPSEPAQAAAETTTAAPPDPPAEAHLRITAETSIDRDTRAPRAGGGATPSGLACIDDAALDLASWGYEGTAAEGISARRGALLGEFDRPDPAAVLDLARYYLYLGFGAEAKATVNAFGVDGRDAELVVTLAALLDGDATVLPGILAGQAACPGRAALWGTIAEATRPGVEAPDSRAVLAAFAELPLHLRRQLGPELAARFLAAGDSDTALALRDATMRAAGEETADFALVDAELARGEGHPAAADDLLELAGSGELRGARAYAAYLDGELAAGRVPRAGSLTAEALSFEAGPSDEGRRLAELAIDARLAEGDFDGARREILRRGAGASPEDAAGAAARWAKFADAITAGAPDAEFLRQAFAARDTLAERLPPGPAATALAVRLTGLGFADEALRYLPPSPAGRPAGEAARFARAEALLQSGRAAAAFGELAGIRGSAADRLRGRALLALGDARAAAERFAAAGDHRMADLAAQRAGAWDRLSEAADPRLRRVAELYAAPAAPVPGPVTEPGTPETTAEVPQDVPAGAAADTGMDDPAAADARANRPIDAPTGRAAAARAALESARKARELVQALLDMPAAEAAAGP